MTATVSRGGAGYRSVEQIKNSASSSRVLNLHDAWARFQDQPEYSASPFFNNKIFNRSILIKHTLRRGEAQSSSKRVRTKILIPFASADLSLGASSCFVDEALTDTGLQTHLGFTPTATGYSRDRQVLTALSELPSLDPFLVRERLRSENIEVARCYLQMSAADLERVKSHVENELNQLVRMAFEGSGEQTDAFVGRLAEKFLSDENADQLAPLRATLGLSGDAYREGVFAWKGFLYYQWNYKDIVAKLKPTRERMASLRFTDCDNETRVELRRLREQVLTAFEKVTLEARDAFRPYETAFSAMTEAKDPSAFKNFLLQSPRLFLDLGERIGRISHIVSFCAYRFSDPTQRVVPAEDAIEIFSEFEASLYDLAARPVQSL